MHHPLLPGVEQAERLGLDHPPAAVGQLQPDAEGRGEEGLLGRAVGRRQLDEAQRARGGSARTTRWPSVRGGGWVGQIRISGVSRNSGTKATRSGATPSWPARRRSTSVRTALR